MGSDHLAGETETGDQQEVATVPLSLNAELEEIGRRIANRAFEAGRAHASGNGGAKERYMNQADKLIAYLSCSIK